MTKEEIVAATQKTVEAFSQVCNGADDLVFFKRQGNKWSVAENIQHLIISFNTTTLAYSLPRIFVRWIGESQTGLRGAMKHWLINTKRNWKTGERQEAASPQKRSK